MKKIVYAVLAVMLVAGASGCATTRQESDLKIQSLRNQVSALESKLQEKDEKIMELEEDLRKAKEQNKGVVYQAKILQPSTKQIQIALKNAGFNPGSIDGRMGRQTRDAIRAFQRANNLNVDGKAGKKTWELLKQYLDKKVK